MENTRFCSICHAIAWKKNGKIDRTCGHWNAKFITRKLKNECVRLFQKGQSDALEGMFSKARAGIDADSLTRKAEEGAEKKMNEEVKQMSDDEIISALIALVGYDPSRRHSPFVSMVAWAKSIRAEKNSRGL